MARERVSLATQGVAAAIQLTDDREEYGGAAGPDSRIAIPQQVMAGGVAQNGELRAQRIDRSGPVVGPKSEPVPGEGCRAQGLASGKALSRASSIAMEVSLTRRSRGLAL